MSEIEDVNNSLVKPFDGLDIKAGDTIVKVNETEIDSVENLKEEVNKSEGNSLNLTLMRDGTMLTANIMPAQTEENEYKLGLWVKDTATGVGTMTFYNKDSQKFAALGHGITDNDTDKLIDIDFGEIVTSKIISITKSEDGKAGEIKGAISGQATIGKVTKNTEFGIYGEIDNLMNLGLSTNESMQVAIRSEIEKGKAEMLCTLEDGVTRSYEIEIEDIYYDNDFNNKSMLIKVTDEELLKKTGGIVRGLSGSPIIQNGKFVRCGYQCSC
jgi:stage IV sporulation protein B